MPWKAVIDWRTPLWAYFGRVVMVEHRDELEAAIAAEVNDPTAEVTVHLITEVGPTAYALHLEMRRKRAEYIRLAKTAQAGRHVGL